MPGAGAPRGWGPSPRGAGLWCLRSRVGSALASNTRSLAVNRERGTRRALCVSFHCGNRRLSRSLTYSAGVRPCSPTGFCGHPASAQQARRRPRVCAVAAGRCPDGPLRGPHCLGPALPTSWAPPAFREGLRRRLLSGTVLIVAFLGAAEVLI